MYAYCGNDPVNNIDPSGHLFFSTLVLTSMIVGAVIGGGISAASSIAKGDNVGEVLLKAAGGALVGGVIGLATGIGASVASGVALGSLTIGQTAAVGLGVATVGAASAGAINSVINQTIDNDWNFSAISGKRIASDAFVTGVKGVTSFVVGMWLGGLWNFDGAAPGLTNLTARVLLNAVIGGGLRMSIDAIYAKILGEECGWISFLEKTMNYLF